MYIYMCIQKGVVHISCSRECPSITIIRITIIERELSVCDIYYMLVMQMWHCYWMRIIFTFILSPLFSCVYIICIFFTLPYSEILLHCTFIIVCNLCFLMLSVPVPVWWKGITTPPPTTPILPRWSHSVLMCFHEVWSQSQFCCCSWYSLLQPKSVWCLSEVVAFLLSLFSTGHCNSATFFLFFTRLLQCPVLLLARLLQC